MRRIVWLVTAVATLVLIGGGLAYASIPDGSGVIHGCRKNSDGSVRVIDSDAGQSCAAGWTALNWSQAGPQGQVGPTGPTGPTGPAGTLVGQRYAVDGVAQTYDAGISFVPCPLGQLPISGSAYVWPYEDGGYGLGIAAMVEIQVSPDSPNSIAVVLRSDRTIAVGVSVWGFCAEVQS